MVMDETQQQPTRTAFGPLCIGKTRASYIAECKRSNNTAEISALVEALLYLGAQSDTENIEYIIHYDSKYSCNLGTGDSFPKPNFNIIAMLKKVCSAVSRHRKIDLQRVKGHSNVLGNELADRAAERGRTAVLPSGGRFAANGVPFIDSQTCRHGSTTRLTQS